LAHQVLPPQSKAEATLNKVAATPFAE